MIDLLPALVVLGTSVWVLVDARRRGITKGKIKGFFNMGPAGWFFSCLLMWIVAFPAYLVKRRTLGQVAVEDGQPSGVQGTDLISQLGALADRYSQGLLTEEEFQAKKKALVHRMLEQSSDDKEVRTVPFLS